MSKSSFEHILGGFLGKRMVVIGDLMLDEYQWGVVSRISPEAPVPIVHVRSRTYRPGGAANVVANLKALGAECSVVGVVGADAAGETLITKLRHEGIGTDGVLADPGRPTTLKCRILAGNQHVVRLDHENTDPVSPELAKRLVAQIESAIEASDGVIISDYVKGAVSDEVARRAIECAGSYGKFVTVDTKRTDLTSFKGAGVITPNVKELEAISGRVIGQNTERIINASLSIMDRYALRNVMVTRSEEGLTLVSQGKPPYSLPALAREVADVTGAGDTVVAVFSLSVAAGAAVQDAAILANAAAAMVVTKRGTATVTLDEISAGLEEALLNGRQHVQEVAPSVT